MRTARIAIVGAGLSGMYAAYLLERKGIRDYIVLEARDIPGGRIASFDASGATAAGTSAPADAFDRFDLGPAWFWPDYQRQLDRVISDLGLGRFAQHEAGDMVAERVAGEPPMRLRGYASSPASMRLVGGMGSLIDALRREVDETRILTGQAVRRLRRADRHVELDSEDDGGRVTTWRARHVLLAMPPRLTAHTIAFSPALPQALAEQWRDTPTWMA
ncbi:MAG: FAD-dependent oxidoreductase, partial [Noviherbaspirillum sp.]